MVNFESRSKSILANTLACTPVDSNDVNIVNTKGGEILLNGVAPSGGGASLPIIGQGNISVTGNIYANGDGLSNGELRGQTIKSVDNIVITAGSLEVNQGGVDIKGNGNVTLQGSGDINVLGTGNIGVGTGGVTSIGDIQTSSGDIVSAGDIFFEGTDIKHRTESGGVVTNTSYKDFKQLVGLNDNNTFTGSNKFNSNVTEFSEKVSVGTRDAGGLFTQNLALNKSGNIECQTINNASGITCGTINCDNGGDNSCAAKTFTTRTSGAEGWVIEQQEVAGDFLDNVLQIKGGQAGAFITIIDSNFSGFLPNITLAPRTVAEGGQIQTDSFKVGDGGNSFEITQPKSGADSNNLLIKAGLGNTPIKFQNNAGTTDLVRIEPDGTDGSGRIYCPAIYFGTTGIHNSIVNDVSGAGNLNLKIRQATASSEVLFLDNNDAEIIRVQKTQVELGTNIPLLFGAYSFRPQMYSLTRTLTISGTADTTNFSNMAFNCRSDTWNDVNNVGTVSMYNASLEGYYKCTITQTGTSSAGNFNFCDIMFDYVFHMSTQTTPDIIFTEPSYNYRKKPTNQGRPTIEIDHLNTPVQSQPVFVLYSGQNSGETMPIEVRLTKLDF